MPRYQRRKDQRPDEIVAAAFATFAERGYADTPLELVAERAGVSKGLVYLYFKTKQDLFKAVVKRVVLPRIDALDARVAADTESVSDFLRGPFLDLGAGLAGSPVRHVIRLLIAEGPKHPDLTAFYHREVVSRGLRTLRRLVQRGIDSGEFCAGKDAYAAQLLLAPVLMSVIWSILFERHEKLDVRAMLAIHVEHIIAALSADTSGAESHGVRR